MSKRPQDIFAEGLLDEDTKEKWLNGDPLPGESDKEKVSEFAPPVAPRIVTLKNIFSNPEAHPVALDFVLLKAFRAEWFTWLPDTLFSEIEQTFKTSINEANKSKIMATMTLHVTDSFWEKWEVFEKTIAALNGITPRVSWMQPADVTQVLTAVDALRWIRQEEFSEEVSRYTAACFLFDNVHYAPPPCDYAQKYISQPKYTCKDCEKSGSALPPFDGFCDSCSLKFEQDKAFSLKPDPDRHNKEHGQSVSYSLTYDPASIKRRFEELDHTPAEKMVITETDVDIQAAKLIAGVDFMRFRHGQLIEQLTTLRSWLEGA